MKIGAYIGSFILLGGVVRVTRISEAFLQWIIAPHVDEA